MLSSRSKLADFLEELRGDAVGGPLARGASGAFVAKMVGAAITVGVQALLARLLGVAEYGVFSYVLSSLIVLSAVTRMGLDFTVLRFAAGYRSRREWGLLRGVLAAAHRWALCSSAIAAAAMAIVVLALGDYLDRQLLITFLVGSSVLPLMTLLAIAQASLRALGHVVFAVAAEFAVLPLVMAALVGAAWLSSPDALGSPGAMGLHAGACAITLGLLLAWLLRTLRRTAETAVPETRAREWFRVTFPLLLWTTFAFANSQVDMLMVGALRGKEAAGLYQAAVRLAGLALWGLFAINAVAGPMIARLHAQGKSAELQRLVSLSAFGIALLTFPVAVLLVVLGPWLLDLFGPAYRPAYLPLVLLVVGHCANASAGSVGYLLMMTGHEREAAAVMAAATTVNLILNALLVPPFGLTGAALAALTSTVLWNAIFYWRVRKHLGVDPTIVGALRARGANARRAARSR